MLRAVIDVCVPILVFAAMFVVGVELTADDFRRVARRPGIVAAATLGQFVILPVIAWALVSCLRLQPTIISGLLLVAACPSGAMANVYTYLARSNVALSVTLTAVSCMTALVMTPLTLAVLQSQTDESQRIVVPMGALAGQLIVLLILPVLSGMFARHRWPDVTRRHARTFLAASIASLAALLVAIIVRESQQFAGALREIAMAATLLTVLAFLAGWATGWAGRASTADRFALGAVFVVRNVGVATAIAVTVLGRSEFAVFATAYFLTQVPIVLAAVFVFRRTRVDESCHVPGVAGQ